MAVGGREGRFVGCMRSVRVCACVCLCVFVRPQGGLGDGGWEGFSLWLAVYILRHDTDSRRIRRTRVAKSARARPSTAPSLPYAAFALALRCAAVGLTPRWTTPRSRAASAPSCCLASAPFAPAHQQPKDRHAASVRSPRRAGVVDAQPEAPLSAVRRGRLRQLLQAPKRPSERKAGQEPSLN